MKLILKITTNAKNDEIIQISDFEMKVKLKAKPEDGKANKALIKLLSKHFGVSQSKIHIKLGEFSKQKIVEIEGL